MATDETQVCNQALLLLGERGLLASFDEDTNNAKRCRAFYDSTVLKCFEAYPWPFAKKTAALVRAAGKIDGKYAYKLPKGFAGFAVESDAETYPREGEYLLADAESLTLKYIEVKQEGLWPGHFVDLVATLLASKLAYPITESRTKAADMLTAYKEFLNEARGNLGRVVRTDQSEDLRNAHR
ncbi:MAG: hypothetical protein QNK05_20140 [Myxococcota bacterium]|nr:hypothetical protein [Myxococcota bacterium]